MIRVIPVILYDGTVAQAVKTIQFKDPRNIGSVVNLARVYNARGVDELIFIDISASRQGRSPKFSLIESFAKELSCPFAVGGGIRDAKTAQAVLDSGADRVVLSAWDAGNPCLREIGETLGTQAIVASVDVLGGLLWDYQTDSVCRRSLLPFVREISPLVGEIFLTSVDREGTSRGYDTSTLKLVVKAAGVSVIANGGAGCVGHAVEAARSGARGVGAASMFQFSEITPKDVKRCLAAGGFEVRT